MAIDKRISYRFGNRGYQGSSPSRSYGPPGSKSRQSAPTHQPSNQPSRGPSGPPSVLNPPTKKKTTVTTGGGGPPSVLNPPTPTVTTGGPPSVLNPPTSTPQFIRKFNKNIAKNSLWSRWQQHKMMSNLMKEGRLKDYHQLGAHDFTQRFNVPDWLSKGLATGYQYASELGRQFIPVNQNNIYTALGEDLRKDKPFEPLGAIVGSISDALSRAKEESRLGHLGIEGLTGPQQEIYNQYAKTFNPVLKTMYKADGGLINLYKHGGFLG